MPSRFNYLGIYEGYFYRADNLYICLQCFHHFSNFKQLSTNLLKLGILVCRQIK